MPDTLFPVLPEIAANAHVTAGQYTDLAARAAADPQGFWARNANASPG